MKFGGGFCRKGNGSMRAITKRIFFLANCVYFLFSVMPGGLVPTRATVAWWHHIPWHKRTGAANSFYIVGFSGCTACLFRKPAALWSAAGGLHGILYTAENIKVLGWCCTDHWYLYSPNSRWLVRAMHKSGECVLPLTRTMFHYRCGWIISAYWKIPASRPFEVA